MKPDLTRSERLDRLPVTGKHKKLLVGSGIGWALDAMDVGLVSFIIAALAVHWDLDKTTTSWIASVGFIGMAIGAALGGLLADKIGRRHVFAITLLVYGLATGASALAGSVAVLIIFRFLTGLGLGAELPVASTLVSEFAPRHIRGRMVVWLEAFWAVGWILAAVIGTFVVAKSENGWRWGLALGAVPAVYALYVRMKMPESVRFLESRGRDDEAEEVVRSFEADVPPSALIDAPPASNAPHENATDSSIWGPGLRRRTAAFWIVWFCVSLAYYGAFTWIPSLLVDQGFSLVRSFSFTLIITLAQLPGYALAGWLIEVWGRRTTLAVFLVGSAVSAGLYGLAAAPWQIIAAGCYCPCLTWVRGVLCMRLGQSSTPPLSALPALVRPQPLGAWDQSWRPLLFRPFSYSADKLACSACLRVLSLWRPRQHSRCRSNAARS